MDDLNKFREEWLHELENRSDVFKSPKEENIRQNNLQCCFEKSKYESRAFQLAHSLLRGEHLSDDDIYQSSKRQNCHEIRTDCPVKKAKTLVDTLIKDLDEINEIPFFDISLPREIALKIFFHLDVVDLCRCAQVSRSWKSLAEDELLWYNISCELGFQKGLTSEVRKWKKEVTNAIQTEKKIRSNWKNRIGRLYEMEDVRSGILSAAHSFQEYIVAGYSTGKVCLWDFRNDAKQEKKTIFDPFSQQSNVMHNHHKNSVCSLSISSDIAVIGYERGQAYVLSNKNNSSLLESYNLTLPITSVVTDCSVNAVGICSSNKCIMINAVGGICNFQKLYNYSTKVNYLSFIPSAYDITAVISRDDALHFQKLNQPEDEEPLIIHHLIGSFVSCLDVSNDLIAAGLTSSTGYNIYQVSLFTTDNGRLFGILSDHLGQILSLNLRKSPDNLIATGCRDKRVRIFDLRTLHPEISISAHSYGVSCVEMDNYHIVTGGDEGLVCIWDIRTKSKLWEMYNRHPVKYLCCDPTKLVTANIPTNKNPEPDDGEIVVHKQQRGSLRMYDFSADQITKDIPSICLSSYDEPAGYNYNIRLSMPYDDIR